MNIREEYLNAGFSNEYVDERAKEEYECVVDQIEKSKKKFKDIKIIRFLCTDWSEYLISRLAWYYYRKEKAKNRKIPEFTGDKNNPIEVYEYNLNNGIMPIETIDNKDGTFTHKYEDGIVVNVKVTSSGVIDGEIWEKMNEDNRRFLAVYLNISEEEVINMSENEIESLVKKNEFNKKVKKVLGLNNNKTKKED